MNVERALEEVVKHLDEPREYGSEVVSRCPYCGSEKKKFYINKTTGMFNCKRGSCVKKGNLTSLSKHLGLDIKIEYPDFKAKKAKKATKEFIVMNESKLKEIEDGDQIAEYFEQRGISPETLRETGCKRIYNKIAFITRDGDNVANVTYRTTEKGFSMEVGSQPYLWGYENLDKKNKRLYIAEGHVDALTLIEMGIENVVSVPMGAGTHHWIEIHWDLLKKFEEIVLCYDNDDAGKSAIEDVTRRLDFATISTLDYGDYKDINEMYMEDPEALFKTTRKPEQADIDGFISLRGTSTSSSIKTKLYSSGLSQLDRIYGGIRPHEYSIICAESGAGKSTTISNMLKGIIYSGEKAAIYSGELGNAKLKSWLYSTMGGEKAIEKHPHPFRPGDNIITIKPEFEDRIDKAVDGKLFVYDGARSKAMEMIDKFEMLHKKYGVAHFFLDNLSVLDMSIKGYSKYEAEEEVAKRLARFTKENPIHLYAVAHPTKTSINTDPNFIDRSGRVKPLERYNQYMVKGSAAIVNLAHNILFLSRANAHERAYYSQAMQDVYTKKGQLDKFKDIKPLLEKEFSMLAYLDKNREGGNVGESALFGYDKDTRRLYGLMSKEDDLNKEIIINEKKESEENLLTIDEDEEI